MNEYEQHGALTDEKREDLSQLVSEFMAKGVVKGGRAGHEAIAEATLILFPGTFEDDPKTLAEALYNRLSRQTQQRYGTESPEENSKPPYPTTNPEPTEMVIKPEPNPNLYEDEGLLYPEVTYNTPPESSITSSHEPQSMMNEQSMIPTSHMNDLPILSKKLRTVAITNYRKFKFRSEPVFHVFFRDNDIKGKIQCPECQKWISITLGKSYEGAPRNWISSNFVTHFKGRHSEYMQFLKPF
ncbi:uncharacterized protein LOC134836170 isoform X1 [Culicoides brevitarsis]|uniref:uncharacterized protein LOC134836170 isoform X1 n=1 Tax=Culicoides brevitarsis TaxID=469753 RepID=UPI00307CAB98